MSLDPKIVTDVKAVQERLTESGELLSPTQLQQYLNRFRERFGPEKLASVDGEALLTLMHDHGNKDSLVYWLEFKDDQEFPARFGSILGGSALKFGIYRRKETGVWMTGSSKKQSELTIDQAVEIARNHRDQLLKGIDLLAKLPAGGNDEQYAQLQADMNRLAPDVSDLAWGHKYFSLLFPDELDDFHSPDWQRFHLIVLLQLPPEGDGRYLAAGRFVALAQTFGTSINNLTTILNRRRPKRSYWRIGTSDTKAPRNQWEPMRSGQYVAIGWPKLGDLAGMTHDTASKEKIRGGLAAHYPGDASTLGRKASQILQFVSVIQPGDIVVPCDGATALGIGRVTGDYQFDPTREFPHRRSVEWLSLLNEWKLPEPEGLRTTVHQLKAYPQVRLEVERRLVGAQPITPPPPAKLPDAVRQEGRSVRLHGLPGRIQSILERKGQVILYGPPGTGKTHWAQTAARELAAWAWFGRPYGELADEEKRQLAGANADSSAPIRTCCFHPAYGYEDFIEGYRPASTNGQMRFELRDGVFKRLCQDALEQPERPFFLIIDEVNRGDVPRIFGELLHALEMDKRGNAVLLPVSGTPLAVPRNVCVIGTMNTADRSIALLDTALRRRFGFVELMPDVTVLEHTIVHGIPLGPWLAALNQRVCKHVGRDARNLQVGHAYFLDTGKPVTSFARFTRILREDVVPLLQDYCYEDYAALEQILGEALVDRNAQRIKQELFEDSRQEELVQALLAPCPDIVTTQPATIAPAEFAEEDDDGDIADEEPGEDQPA